LQAISWQVGDKWHLDELLIMIAAKSRPFMPLEPKRQIHILTAQR
jgi:hypothetical protein